MTRRVDRLSDRLGLSFSAFLGSMSDAELGRAIAPVKASIAGESIDAESAAMIGFSGQDDGPEVLAPMV